MLDLLDINTAGVETHNGKIGSWASTRSGLRFYPFDVSRHDDVAIEDIAAGLARATRFNGQYNLPMDQFYSAAQHSDMGSRIAEDDYGIEIARIFLLHDAPEFICSDLIRPIKIWLNDYHEAETVIAQKIGNRFGVDLVLMPPEIKLVDNLMCDWERRDLFPGSEPYPGRSHPGNDFPEIAPQSPNLAYRNFCRRFNELFPEVETFFDH